MCIKFQREVLVIEHMKCYVKTYRQARNQLGTPGGAKSFLRGAQIL